MIELNRHIVYVWYHYIEDFHNPLYEMLSEELPEKIRHEITSYKKKEDGIRKLCGRLLLQQAIEWSGSKNVGLKNLSKGEYKKPVIEQWLPFNISHSGKLVVLAFSINTSVGIDIEWKENKTLDYPLLLQVLHPNEQATIVSSKDTSSAFYNCWTKKEALLKAMGCGLTSELNTFDTSAKDVVELKGKNWFLSSLHLHPEYACSVATEYASVQLKIIKKNILSTSFITL